MPHVLDSVRNVATSAELMSVSAGDQITCTANGNPSPSFKWQVMKVDRDGKWKDVPEVSSQTIKAQLNNGSSAKLRCVAKNSVNGEEYSENSREISIELPQHEALLEHIGISYKSRLS